MISLDTNILVRLLTNDEPQQASLALKALNQAQADRQRIWVSVIVLCELVWVLQRLYGYDKAQVLVALGALLAFAGLDVEHSPTVKKTLDEMRRSSADFADILLGQLSAERGAAFVLTFDKKAAKLGTHKLLA